MKRSIKKYLSLFLLLTFLYPFAEKGIHDFEHRNDFHCSTKADKHIHSQEHNCSVCDYNSPASGAEVKVFGELSLPFASFSYPHSGQAHLSLLLKYSLPSRAPPLC